MQLFYSKQKKQLRPIQNNRLYEPRNEKGSSCKNTNAVITITDRGKKLMLMQNILLMYPTSESPKVRLMHCHMSSPNIYFSFYFHENLDVAMAMIPHSYIGIYKKEFVR